MLAKFKPTKKISAGSSAKHLPKKMNLLKAVQQFQPQRGVSFQKNGFAKFQPKIQPKFQLPKSQPKIQLKFQGMSFVSKPVMRGFQTPLFFARSQNVRLSLAQFSSVRTAAEQLEARLSRTDTLFPQLNLKDGIQDAKSAINKAGDSENKLETLSQFARHLCSSHHIPASSTVQITQMIETLRSAQESTSRMDHLGQKDVSFESLKDQLSQFPEVHQLAQKLQAQIRIPQEITASQEQEDKIAHKANLIVGEIETAFDFLEKNNTELANEKAEVDHYIENIDLLTVKGELQKRPALIEKIDEDIIYDRWSHDEEED